jgi:membrane-associated phospholipid phosphatase
MANSRAQHHHDSEWIYSTPLSKHLLSPLNDCIHGISSLPHPIEVVIAAFGYAFNPMVFPCWPILIYGLAYRGVRSSLLSSANKKSVFTNALDAPAYAHFWDERLRSYTPEQQALFITGCYLASVAVTLASTELAKAAFATTRPRLPPEGHDGAWRRRYGKLVGSLKSTHAFPSGDCAQAMNLCLYLGRYLSEHVRAAAGRDVPLTAVLFGIFLPGVAFARVFYRCHWAEDCLGGVVLSWTLHEILRCAVAPIDLHMIPS